MENYYNNANQDQIANENLENMYPEVYMQIHPFVVNAADDMRRSGRPITREMLDSAVDNIIRMSGMWDEDGELDEAVYDDQAVGRPGRPGRRPFRRRRPMHHNRNTLRDIARILLLRQFF